MTPRRADIIPPMVIKKGALNCSHQTVILLLFVFYIYPEIPFGLYQWLLLYQCWNSNTSPERPYFVLEMYEWTDVTLPIKVCALRPEAQIDGYRRSPQSNQVQ